MGGRGGVDEHSEREREQSSSDALGEAGERPGRPAVPPDALEAAVAWLRRSHDATGREGSSNGFTLLHGWLPACPETTGYVIGSFLAYGARRGDRSDLVQRAREMGDWERDIQEPDGGVMEGAIGMDPARSYSVLGSPVPDLQHPATAASPAATGAVAGRATAER